MEFRDALLSLGVAVAAGALIGAEREQSKLAAPNAAGESGTPSTRTPHDFGGIRTFPLIALAGGLSALLIPVVGAWVLGVALAGLAALLSIAYFRTSANGEPGLTTEAAAVLTFLLGAMAAMPGWLPGAQRYLLVASCSAIIMALLALKRPLHGFAAKISADDVYATAKFVLLVLVVLPILPDRTVGPLDVLNPQKIGIMIVLVAAVSFVGYVAARVTGSRRGLFLTGILGGFASSTAVTLTFSGRAKEQPSLVELCSIAILAGSATMFVRILLIVAAVDRPLLVLLSLPLGLMAAGGFGAAALVYRSSIKHDAHEEVPLKNPFYLAQSIKFGLAYAVILVIAKAAQLYLGQTGVLAGSVVAGLAEVDAITLSLTELHQGGMSADTAAIGITLAAVTNTLVKTALAFVLGGRALGKRVGLGLAAALLCGAATLVIHR
ncbi:MAG: MgtC/SapB family protein [Byssovorax sp.]